jgi:16S rRNA (guanine1207-N2)-methyltransferase
MRYVSGEHYFTADPTAPSRERRIEFDVDGRTYRLVTSGGVFSAGRLDLGTSVLLHKAPVPAAGTEGALLDLGCGYGPVAVVLATSAPKADVYAVDVNQRALDLARANAAALKLDITVATPDAVPDDVRFAEIWSNPPIRVGKAELHDLLDRWLPRLADDGVAWLVVARNLGADSLQEWLAGRGWAAQRYASQKGYRVLRVSRNPGDNGAGTEENF